MHRFLAGGRAVAAVTLSVGSLVAVACGQVTPSAGTSPAPPPPPVVPTLDWRPCGPDHPGRECAVATVPLDHDRPRGATTQVALARIPAADPATRIGSLFLNPGGPGASGVDVVLAEDGPALSAMVGGRFDVVGFDPRGVGASDPLQCFASEDERSALVFSLPRFPYRPEQYRTFFAGARTYRDECHDEGQAITAHMSTADVARDLDLLRQAVGDAQLTYIGFSYGSFLGTTYANLFPGKVRALAIDAVLDPRLWSSGWQIRADRVDVQEELDEFLRLCDEAGAACAFSSPEGSAARWEALAEALRAEPLEIPGRPAYTYDLLLYDVSNEMYDPESWGDPDGGLAVVLDTVADAVLTGQAAASATDVGAVLQSRHHRLAESRPGPETGAAAEAGYDNQLDAFYGNHCADAEYPATLGGFRAIDRYAAEGSRFGPLQWWLYAVCARWPVNDDRYVGPWSARTSAPVLVVGTRFDGLTGYAGAEAVADLLPNSRLLTYDGWGHVAFGRSGCVREHVLTYLVDGTLPPDDTVCPANPSPFAPSAAAAAADPDPLLTTDAPILETPPTPAAP